MRYTACVGFGCGETADSRGHAARSFTNSDDAVIDAKHQPTFVRRGGGTRPVVDSLKQRTACIARDQVTRLGIDTDIGVIPRAGIREGGVNWATSHTMA